MDDRNKPGTTRDSSWDDEQDRMTNPNRRQEEDRDSNVESSPSDQRARDRDPGSSESPPTDDREQLHGDRQQETSRRQRQTEE